MPLAIADNPAMFTAIPGDVILRASIDGVFHVVDAATLSRVSGPLPLHAALEYAHQQGAPHIFHQAVDLRGRLMGDPVRVESTWTPTRS